MVNHDVPENAEMLSEPLDCVVRPVRRSDLLAISNIHKVAFPKSVITQLGLEAVRRYYDWQLSPIHNSVGLVAVRDGRVVGFCFGGVFHGALAGFLRKNAGYLVRALALRPAMLLQSRFWEQGWDAIRLFRRIARRRLSAFRGQTNTQTARDDEVAFGILAIATDVQVRSKGVGRQLMEAIEAEAARQGFKRMNLSVDIGNEQAILFYESLGWRRAVRGKVWLGVMERVLH